MCYLYISTGFLSIYWLFLHVFYLRYSHCSFYCISFLIHWIYIYIYINRILWFIRFFALYSLFRMVILMKYLTFQALDIDEIRTHFLSWNTIKSKANNNVTKVKYWFLSSFIFDISFDHQLFTIMYPTPITMKHKRKENNVTMKEQCLNYDCVVLFNFNVIWQNVYLDNIWLWSI